MIKIKNIFIKTTLFLTLLSSSLFAVTVGNATNYLNPFEPAFNLADNIIYGDYVSIASSVECVDDGSGDCDDAYDGYLFDATTIYKNSVSSTIIPLNSSTETLTLPNDINGSDILFAGLYWQGNITGDDEANYNTIFNNNLKHGGIIGRDKVTMIDASGTKHNLTADKVWYHDFWGVGTGNDGGHRSFYQAYKDVTSILKDSYRIENTNTVGNIYTVGNIKASAGADYGTYFWADASSSFNNVRIGFWGNWQLIVVYSHSNIAVVTPKPKPKNIAIFHGFQPLIPLIPDSTKSIDINVTGFLTPKQAPINAKMLFYGSGGEKKLKYDLLEIQDKKTTNFLTISNATNPVTGAFNGSISSFGVPIDATISYYPGTDSDEFNVSNAMDTTQSETVLRLSAKNVGGTGDQFFPGLIAFSTDVYEPNFCYDYAYKQLNRFFTEDNDGFQNPRIVGDVAPQEPITVTVYLKNLVDSDVLVKDVNLSVQDINTTQATYVRNSTYLALNSSFKSSLLDSDIISNGGSVSDSSISGIPIGDLNTNDYFYTYYDLNTTAGTEDVNMTLNVNASYTLVTATTSIPYSLQLSSDIPMCTTSSYQYTSEKGNFNLVHENYYDYDTATPTKRFYNLPTQVTNRVGNFKVISIDENETLTPRSTVVAVEIIDAAAFHSASRSCTELASSIAPRVWMIFDDSQSVNFNKAALTAAYSNGQTTLNPPSELYKNARENAAFRVSQPLDNNESLQVIERVPPTNLKWQLKDFPDYAGEQCVNGAGTITSICGTDGSGVSGTGMDEAELTSCMECIYGISTQLTCSRDNFAIRPDSFSFVFNDTNETLAPKQKLTDNLTAVEPTLNLATGYKYNIDINATSYLSSSASNGYTKLYNIFNTKDMMAYIWSPTTALTGCNDDSNSTLSFRISNGSIDLNLPAFDQVGRYRLNINDTSWTTSDNDPAVMQHHSDTNATYPDGSAMFTLELDGSASVDCVLNSSTTEDESSIVLNGCNISSSHNSGSGVITSDIFTTFHPYELNVSALLASHGPDNNITFPTTGNSAWIYMSDISNENNMSLNFIGNIVAEGFNGIRNSNFVDGCYAKPLTLSLKSSIVNATADYKYHFTSRELNSSTIYDSWDTNNSSQENLNLTTANFPKDANGSLAMSLHYNYEHNISVAINPQKIDIVGLDVRCTNTVDCQMQVNQISNHENNQTVSINAPLIHYYGLVNAGKQRFDVPTDNPYNTKIYYQIYCFGAGCDTTLLPSLTHVNDIRWYQNIRHQPSNDGNVSSVVEKDSIGKVTPNSLLNTTNPTTVNLPYDGSSGYPYTTTMEVNASNWLIYNDNNAGTTLNSFQVEFNKAGTEWSGAHETDGKTNSTGNIKTNRRTMW